MGRLAFGFTMLAGNLALWLQAASLDTLAGLHAGEIIAMTWGAAIAAGMVAARIARRSPRPSATLFKASLVIPAVGIALILPLTLHLIVFALEGTRVGEFDEWTRMSLVFVGLAHVVFAAMIGVRAARLAGGSAAASAWAIYGWTVLAAAFPFIVFYGLPPAIVAVTGLPVIPLIAWMKPYIERERACEETQTDLPRAVVVAA